MTSAACGKSAEEQCELYCEKLISCGYVDSSVVGDCEAECRSDTEVDACKEALDGLMECIGDQCSDPDCASEANRTDNDCP